MKKIKIICLLSLILVTLTCDLGDGKSYNNAYAQEWFKTNEIGNAESWEVVRLDLSDRSFEVSEATLDSDANLSSYTGTTKGSIEEVDLTTLTMTVEEIYFDAGWYSRDAYIALQIDLGQSEAEAVALADNHFISTTINYIISSNPATLTISGINDFSGDYYNNVMASVING